jgi:hypothetical protein
MRLTVIVLDTLIYVPALMMFVRTWLGSRSRRTQVLRFLFFFKTVTQIQLQECSLAGVTTAACIFAGRFRAFPV